MRVDVRDEMYVWVKCASRRTLVAESARRMCVLLTKASFSYQLWRGGKPMFRNGRDVEQAPRRGKHRATPENHLPSSHVEFDYLPAV